MQLSEEGAYHYSDTFAWALSKFNEHLQFSSRVKFILGDK